MTFGQVGSYEDLAGSVVVITGAGSGIGRATALAFAKQKSKVIVAGRRQEPLDETAGQVRQLGAECAVILCDVANESSVMQAAATVRERFGGADVLVNNAGTNQPVKAGATDLQLDEWNRIIAINLTGAMLAVKHFAPPMIERRNGAIINVSSLAGSIPRLDVGAYCTSKAGLEHMTRWQALELAAHNIRVNATSPATTMSPMVRESLARDGVDPQNRVAGNLEMFRPRFPLGRTAEVEEQAAPIVFLASSAASFITGQVIQVDGGTAML